jgi:hypothetical protein
LENAKTPRRRNKILSLRRKDFIFDKIEAPNNHTYILVSHDWAGKANAKIKQYAC